MIHIETIETSSLGDRSYLAHDGEVAVVVDPQRDIDRVLALLDEHGVRLTHVFETHIHNDYVTGGLALAQRRARAAERQGGAVGVEHRVVPRLLRVHGAGALRVLHGEPRLAGREPR